MSISHARSALRFGLAAFAFAASALGCNPPAVTPGGGGTTSAAGASGGGAAGGGTGGAADPDAGGFDWAKFYYGDSNIAFERPRGTVDAQGNVFVSATFHGPNDFGDGIPVEAEIGTKDAVLLKLDKTGAFVWKMVFSSPDWDEIRAVHADKDGNVIVGGISSGPIAFGAVTVGPGTFLLKLDPQGNAIWGATEGPLSDCDPKWIDTDAQGNVFVGGPGTSIDWNGVSLKGTGDIYSSFWLGELDGATGILQWARITNAPASSATLRGLSADPTGGVVITGTFTGASLGLSADASVPADILNPGPMSGAPAFLARYDANGGLSAGKLLGAPSDSQSGCRPEGLRVDALGVARVDCNLEGTVAFASGSVTSSNGDFVLVHDDIVGPTQTWTAFQKGSGAAHPADLGIDGHGNTVVWGYYSPGWDPGIGALPSDKPRFVAKLDSKDEVLWARGVTLSADTFQGGIDEMAVGTLEDETILIGTLGADPFDFGPGPDLSWGIYVLRLKK